MELIEKIDKFLLDSGFERVGMKSGIPYRYRNDTASITISMLVDNSMLTEKDEELIKKRLIELGYLNEE